MKVALTGATGYIGSHVLAELQEHGHEATALVQDGARADTVAARGAKPAVVDLHDRSAVAGMPAEVRRPCLGQCDVSAAAWLSRPGRITSIR